MKRWKILLLLIVLLVLVGGAAYLGYTTVKPAKPATLEMPATITVGRGNVEQIVTAPGVLMSARERMLSPSVGGRLSKINVLAGDHVKANDVLAELDDAEFKYAFQIALANLASAQATYDAAVTQYAHCDDQIIVAKTALDKAQIALQQAQSAYDQVAWRSDIGMLPQSRSLQLATVDYQSALASYRLAALAVPSSQDLAIAQANVNATQVAVDQAKDRLNRTKLVAPFEGIVQEVRSQ
ncbi:MAG: biotin/lipoyl-binding protein [Chloroflexi bacterium]|nr:biotin/lipoyl-binding protein [Chloroflexota bacterium]